MLALGLAARADTVVDQLCAAQRLAQNSEQRAEAQLSDIMEAAETAKQMVDKLPAAPASLVAARAQACSSAAAVTAAERAYLTADGALSELWSEQPPRLGWITGDRARRQVKERNLREGRARCEAALNASRQAEQEDAKRLRLEDGLYRVDVSNHKKFWRDRAAAAEGQAVIAGRAIAFVMRNPPFARWGAAALFRIAAQMMAAKAHNKGEDEFDTRVDLVPHTDLWGIGRLQPPA